MVLGELDREQFDEDGLDDLSRILHNYRDELEVLGILKNGEWMRIIIELTKTLSYDEAIASFRRDIENQCAL
jgi:hypothetical protein